MKVNVHGKNENTMPHLQEAALQDWPFASFKGVDKKAPQDRWEVANTAEFAE